MECKNDTQPIVVGIGEMLWDILPTGRRPGGAPANFACHAGRLGAHAFAVSAVGNDAHGNALVNALTRSGLDLRYVQRNNRPTGTVTVTLTNGIPSYVIHTNTAWDNIRAGGLSRLAGAADAVCFGTLAQRNAVSRKAIGSFLSHVRHDCLKVFDINLRQNYYSEAVIRRSLAFANILKINDEELPVTARLLSARGTEASIVRALMREFDIGICVLTKGSHGGMVYTRNDAVSYTPKHVRVKDTVGAGDSFTAGFTIGLLRGMAVSEAVAAANDLAAFVCSQKGAMPKHPARISALFSPRPVD
ncbi:MAG: carbohydrate kinase [Spirochaetota bacterium]